MSRIATLLISALFLATAVAEDAVFEDELVTEDLRRYTVEVIIFSYEEDVSTGSEIFLPDEPPVVEEALPGVEGDLPADVEESATDFAAASDEFEEPPRWRAAVRGSTGEDADTDVSKFQLVLLDETDFALTNASRQFELLDAYATIMHVGWTQPVYPEEETPAIELRLLGKPPEGLTGSFTLYLSRYLHLVVDLALDAPAAMAAPVETVDPAFSYGDSRPQYGGQLTAAAPPIRYRIQEHRIVKNGELRYFDHPKFGVLAKVTRIEEEEQNNVPDLETDAEALLGSTVE